MAPLIYATPNLFWFVLLVRFVLDRTRNLHWLGVFKNISVAYLAEALLVQNRSLY